MFLKMGGESARRIYGKLLRTVGNPCKRGGFTLLTLIKAQQLRKVEQGGE
jgi:hypothetical protein